MRHALAAVLLLPALLAAGPAPAAAADESLALQPAAAEVAPGGSVEIQVLARLHPNGKASVPVRAVDCLLQAKGGGTVAPASDGPGETRWTYRAPESVASPQEVVVEGRLRSYPEAAGACRIRVATPSSGKAPAADALLAEDDEDGELLDGAEGRTADPVGKLVTLVKWRARGEPGEEWNDKKLPPRGEDLYAPGAQHEIRFRVNAEKPRSVTVHWWRDDRPKRVRAFTDRNRVLDLSTDQDGMVNGRFRKHLGRPRGVYTFAVVVVTAEGKEMRENLVIHREKPPRDEEDDGKGKGGGKKK